MSHKKTITAALAGAITLSLLAATPSQAAEAKEELWATNSHAASTASYLDSSIKDIEIHKGEVYSGYGNYSTNIGPVYISSHNTETKAQTDHLLLEGEEVNTFRKINGELLAPNIDPKAGWDQKVGYASSANGWKDVQTTEFIHIYDVASTGDDLWLSGSIVNPDRQKYGDFNYLAAVKRSTDGGKTWTIGLAKASPNQGTNEQDRYYWLAAVNGKVYTSTTANNSGNILSIWKDGKWTEKSMPIRLSTIKGSSADVLGDKVIVATGGLALVVDSKDDSIKTGSETITDTYVDEKAAKIYAVTPLRQSLSMGGATSLIPEKLLSSTDGVNWTIEKELKFSEMTPKKVTVNSSEIEVKYFPTSIAVEDNTIYYGMNTGDIFKGSVKDEPVPLAVEIKVPSASMHLMETTRPLQGVTASAADGTNLTSQVKATKKVNWKGMTMEYKVTYQGITEVVSRTVIY